MIKRPLCLAVLLFLTIQWILTGGVRLEMYAKPSFLERELKEGQWITVTGTVCRREERPDTTLYYLKDNQVQYKHQIIKEPYLLVYFKQEHQQKQMKIGNQIQWKGTVSFFEASTNPGGFD